MILYLLIQLNRYFCFFSSPFAFGCFYEFYRTSHSALGVRHGRAEPSAVLLSLGQNGKSGVPRL